MKYISYTSFLLILTGFSFFSCNDQCTETRYVRKITAVNVALSDVRSSIETTPPRKLERPGKLYVKDNYLFINELKRGVHVIDNSNPSNPISISFIKIPGNGDMAVRGDMLYADSYSDVVVMDISNPKNVVETSRVNDLFRNGNFDGGMWQLHNVASGVAKDIIYDQEVSYETEKVTTNCEDVQPGGGGWWGIGDVLI